MTSWNMAGTSPKFDEFRPDPYCKTQQTLIFPAMFLWFPDGFPETTCQGIAQLAMFDIDIPTSNVFGLWEFLV